MTDPNESTAPQKDIAGKFEDEVLKPEDLEEYRRVMGIFHQSLYRLMTSLFIVDEIERFPVVVRYRMVNSRLASLEYQGAPK